MTSTSTEQAFNTERALAAAPPPSSRSRRDAAQPGLRAPAAATSARAAGARAALPGLAAAVAVGTVATVVGREVPLVGTAVPGAVIGVVLALGWRRRAGVRARLSSGLRFASSRLLQCSVVILGAQLSLVTALRVGLASLPVMLGTLAACLGCAWLYGRLLGVVGDLRTLIGVGTGICGASAIAAVSPVIEASSTDIAYAVSTIFLFNITAVLVFPVIGHALGMTAHSFGLFAGTAVNDTSSVVATATTYGNSAASYAVVVKLVRTLMIIPVCVALSALTQRRQQAAAASAGTAAGSQRAAGSQVAAVSPPSADSQVAAGSANVVGARMSAGAAHMPAGVARMSASRALRLVPWFLIGFVVMAALNSAGAIPVGWHGGLSEVSVFLVAVALSAIGLSTDLDALRRAGARPLLLGAMLWVTVTVASLGLQLLTGTLH